MAAILNAWEIEKVDRKDLLCLLASRIIVVTIFVGLPFAVFAECKSNVPGRKHDSNYIENGDGTVTDMVTGLMWKQCPEGTSESGGFCVQDGSAYLFTWKAALEQASLVNSSGGYAGHTDWRVPNRNELGSLVDRGCKPAINSNIFFDTVGVNLNTWTSTSADGSFAWNISFGDGTLQAYIATWTSSLRLVRDAP